jgi:hypothetical protein
MDQYTASGTLKKGRNEILLKVCQNNQTESWAQRWHYQIRVCDATGTPIPLKVLAAELPTPTKLEEPVEPKKN